MGCEHCGNMEDELSEYYLFDNYYEEVYLCPKCAEMYGEDAEYIR